MGAQSGTNPKRLLEELLVLNKQCRIFMEEMAITPSTDLELILAMPSEQLKTLDVEDVSIEEARACHERRSVEHNVRMERLRVLGEEIQALWDELNVPDLERDTWFGNYSARPLSKVALSHVTNSRMGLLQKRTENLIFDLRARCVRLLTDDDVGDTDTKSHAFQAGSHARAVAAHWDDKSREELSEILAKVPGAVTWDEAVAMRQKVEEHEESGNCISLILQTIARRDRLVAMRQELLDVQTVQNRQTGKLAFKKLQAIERKEKAVKVELPALTIALRKRLDSYAEYFKTPFVLKEPNDSLDKTSTVPYLDVLNNFEEKFEEDMRFKLKARRRPKSMAPSPSYTKRSSTTDTPGKKRPEVRPYESKGKPAPAKSGLWKRVRRPASVEHSIPVLPLPQQTPAEPKTLKAEGLGRTQTQTPAGVSPGSAQGHEKSRVLHVLPSGTPPARLPRRA